jgi:lactate dehydrogenase-like 2-hydroxyacid dehydrogenase
VEQQVALRALSFGMRIQYHNRHPLSPSILTQFPSLSSPLVTYTPSLDDLLSTSDIISLNLGLSDSNRHMLSTPQFEIMKIGVIIVNTARGALIDEDALIRALEEGKVECVGLDVFETEPAVDGRLLGNERILLTPHIAAATVETMVSLFLVFVFGIEIEMSADLRCVGEYGECCFG